MKSSGLVVTDNCGVSVLVSDDIVVLRTCPLAAAAGRRPAAMVPSIGASAVTVQYRPRRLSDVRPRLERTRVRRRRRRGAMMSGLGATGPVAVC
jgi:hypothetical protein